MATIEARTSFIRWNSELAEFLGIAFSIPVLWLPFGIGDYYGAVFSPAVLIGLSLTSILMTLAALASFNPECAYQGEDYGADDFTGDIYQQFADWFWIWVTMALILCLLCLGVEAVYGFAGEIISASADYVQSMYSILR